MSSSGARGPADPRPGPTSTAALVGPRDRPAGAGDRDSRGGSTRPHRRIPALRCVGASGPRHSHGHDLAAERAEALLAHRHLSSGSPSALEDAWLWARLRVHGLSLDDLGRRMCRSKSWVSRRLALLDELGASPGPSARRHDARASGDEVLGAVGARSCANRGHCELLLAGLGAMPVSSREVEALYSAWRRACSGRRQRRTSASRHRALFVPADLGRGEGRSVLRTPTTRPCCSRS
jgi:hypothetical protein